MIEEKEQKNDRRHNAHGKRIAAWHLPSIFGFHYGWCISGE
jgi:hypothetical protein